MENQESPQTDQDVIDWIVDNLVDGSRSRRGVIKKLKELGLIFKAPTKKSNAAAANKNLFIKDEDDKLRELYDEHRLEPDCFAKIMEVFNKKRSKKVVAKRMVQLGLIADESEILPAQKRRNHNGRESRGSSSDESSDEETPQSAPAKPTMKYQMNKVEASKLRTELEESLKEAFEWIIESLKEAAEDFEGPSDDPDDAIPIVPFTESQKSAMENVQFRKLLTLINLQEPQGLETYWKIPANMMPVDLEQRAKLLAGDEVVEERIGDNAESEEDEDLFTRLRAHRDILLYNQSDHEDRAVTTEKVLRKVEKVTKPNTKLIRQLLPSVVGEHKEALEWVVTTLKDKAQNKSSDAVDEMILFPSGDKHRSALMDDNFKQILSAVSFSPPDVLESFWRISHSISSKELMKRAELLKFSEDSSDEDGQQIVIKRKKKPQQQDSFAINTQQLKQRLAELDSSDEESNDTMQTSKRNLIESSGDDDELMKPKQRTRKLSGKRDRNEVDDEPPDENEMNATNNQTKRIRRIADSSDEE